MCSSWTRQRCLDVSTLRETLSVCAEACVCAHVLGHTNFSFFLPFTALALKSVFIPIAPLLHLSTNLSPVSVQEIQENKTSVIIFYWSHFFFSLFNMQTKHEVKTDVVVCFRHAKQLKPTPKSGCDIPWVSGAMHILLAKPRYQHSPSIKLSD